MRSLVENVLYLGKNSIKENKIIIHLLFCRYRLSEISFVLKAVTTLIISMKKVGKGKISFLFNYIL